MNYEQYRQVVQALEILEGVLENMTLIGSSADELRQAQALMDAATRSLGAIFADIFAKDASLV